MPTLSGSQPVADGLGRPKVVAMRAVIGGNDVQLGGF
jgi:hypothetical protein